MFGKSTLKRVITRLTDARERHKERHRTTGYGFVLADSVDFLPANHWDQVTQGKTFFMSRAFLRALELDGPENITPRLALIYRDHDPVAAVAMQIVEISGDSLLKRKNVDGTESGTTRAGLKRRLLLPAVRRVGKHVRERVLVCGNLLSWGAHGVAFARDEDRAQVWPAVAEALYRIRRAERLSGQSDLALVKDFTSAESRGIEALERFSFKPAETEPNMVLELRPEWRSYADYLASLDGKYRKSTQQILKKIEASGCVVERLDDLAGMGPRLHALYSQVHGNNAMRLVTLPSGFLPSIAKSAGDSFHCDVIQKGEEVLGFVTTIHDGDTAVGWYIGFDRQASAELPLYLRLLHVLVANGIELGCQRLSLGRTALEPKARLGAKPEPMTVWIRHRLPALNLALGRLLGAIPHQEVPERNPFKNEAG